MKFQNLSIISGNIQKFKSNARETWCVILVSASWHLLFRITALYTPFRSAQNHCLPDNVRPRGAFISVGDWTPTEKYLLLLTTCRSGSLNSDWDKSPQVDKIISIFSMRNTKLPHFESCGSFLNTLWFLTTNQRYFSSKRSSASTNPCSFAHFGTSLRISSQLLIGCCNHSFSPRV